MLSHIASLLPHCTVNHNNILPLYSENSVVVCVNNKVRHVNIITYFALRNEIHLARHLLTQTLDNIPRLEMNLLNPDQIIGLYSNFNYTAEQSLDVTNMLEAVSYEKLNPLISYLFSINKVKTVVGYSHITGHVPDTGYYEYYELQHLYDNYPEAEYIVSLLEPEARKRHCIFALQSGYIDFNTVDVRYLKLLVDNCGKMRDKHYYLAYAIVYDKFEGDYEHTIVPQFLYNLYCDVAHFRVQDSSDDIVLLERLLTTRRRRRVFDKMLENSDINIPEHLPPQVHKRVAKYCVNNKKNITLRLDGCKYCQLINQV